MQLFEGRRPQVYFDGGRLYQDKKTEKQMWLWKLVIDLNADDAAKCDDVILNNYIAIETRENCVEEIVISHEVPRQCIEFFGLEDHTAPMLYIHADVTALRLTRKENVTQLHFEVEISNTIQVHNFVRDHFFTRLWVTFSDEQMSLGSKLHPARQAQKQRQNRRLN